MVYFFESIIIQKQRIWKHSWKDVFNLTELPIYCICSCGIWKCVQNNSHWSNAINTILHNFNTHKLSQYNFNFQWIPFKMTISNCQFENHNNLNLNLAKKKLPMWSWTWPWCELRNTQHSVFFKYKANLNLYKFSCLRFLRWHISR